MQISKKPPPGVWGPWAVACSAQSVCNPVMFTPISVNKPLCGAKYAHIYKECMQINNHRRSSNAASIHSQSDILVGIVVKGQLTDSGSAECTSSLQRASVGHRRSEHRSCCCVQKMADRFSRFNEERDFQVMQVRRLSLCRYFSSSGCLGARRRKETWRAADNYFETAPCISVYMTPASTAS